MDMIFNRLKKNLKTRRKWARKNGVEAYRLYERDIPEYPFIVDIYADHVVIYEKGREDIDKEKAEHKDHIKEAVLKLFEIDDSKMVFKARVQQKGKDQYERTAKTNEFMTINEHQAKFKVNLYDYLDTGIFLDHRPMRQTVFEESEGKEVLNLFCYTGSVSVFAALGGGSVTSVDMSNTYIEWAKDNFALNNIELDKHTFVTRNALEYIRSEVPKKFDLIFLDPPTFSNSKRMEDSFDVERDQVELVENTMRLLKDGGTLYFSNNKRKFKLDPKLIEKFETKDITFKSIPEDFHDKKIHNCFKITRR